MEIQYNTSKFTENTSGNVEVCYSEEPLHTGEMGQQVSQKIKEKHKVLHLRPEASMREKKLKGN